MGEDSGRLGSFLRELRRRNVVKVAATYAVVAFVAVQVVNLLIPSTTLPTWADELVLALLIAGFPVAVVVAWGFEMTAGGLRRTPPLAEPRGVPGDAGSAAGVRPLRSIAVLPFTDMSPEGDQEYFADGLAEELLNHLAKICDLRVAARTSAFAFRDTDLDIREVADRLDVTHVLEGSVRKSGDRLRLTAQLIDAEDGFHVWSESYDRRVEEVFAVQEDIAKSIVDALSCSLRPPERRALEAIPEARPEAYDFYLRGRQYFNRFQGDDVRRALRLFGRAVEVDPEYAPAHSGLADASSFLYMYWEDVPEHLRTADEASRRAVELDPGLAESHVSRGLTLSLKLEYGEAARHFEAAIELDPQLFEAHNFFGRMRWTQGEMEEAARHFERAVEVRPEDYQVRALLGDVYRRLGREEEGRSADRGALMAAEAHLELHPDDTRAVYLAAAAAANLGDRERAEAFVERALEMAPDDPPVQYNVACTLSRLGETDRALEALERAVELGFSHRAWIENDSDLDPLREEPRFRELLESLGPAAGSRGPGGPATPGTGGRRAR